MYMYICLIYKMILLWSEQCHDVICFVIKELECLVFYDQLVDVQIFSVVGQFRRPNGILQNDSEGSCRICRCVCPTS